MKTTTERDIRKLFAGLLKKHKDLKLNSKADNYYELLEHFKLELRQFILDMDFSCLTAEQVLLLCSMVSSYQPVEPFKFLIICSKIVQFNGIDK
jgi:hypothetical protein